MIIPVKVVYMSEYTAEVTFSNNETGIIDFSFLFDGRKIYEPLKNKALFKTIRMSEDGMCIEWAKDIDISPEETYNQFNKQKRG